MGSLMDALLVLDGPATGPAGILDTSQTTSHLRLENVVSKQYAKAEKSKRRAIHGRLK